MRGLVDIVTDVSANRCLEVVATSRAGSGNTMWHASETSPRSNGDHRLVGHRRISESESRWSHSCYRSADHRSPGVQLSA
jgi:hypothetical protein